MIEDHVQQASYFGEGATGGGRMVRVEEGMLVVQVCHAADGTIWREKNLRRIRTRPCGIQQRNGRDAPEVF